MFLGTDWNFTEFSNDRCVTFIPRMNCNRAVAQHGLRSCCRNRYVITHLTERYVSAASLSTYS